MGDAWMISIHIYAMCMLLWLIVILEGPELYMLYVDEWRISKRNTVKILSDHLMNIAYISRGCLMVGECSLTWDRYRYWWYWNVCGYILVIYFVLMLYWWYWNACGLCSAGLQVVWCSFKKKSTNYVEFHFRRNMWPIIASKIKNLTQFIDTDCIFIPKIFKISITIESALRLCQQHKFWSNYRTSVYF